MTRFIRVLEFSDKKAALKGACLDFRQQSNNASTFDMDPFLFNNLPSSVFAYWITASASNAFAGMKTFSEIGLKAQVGCSTKDDFRFLRLWWESEAADDKWFYLAKGGRYSPYYAEIHLKINWGRNAAELEAAILKKYPYLGENANWVLHRESDYFKPGITWTRRTKSAFSPRFLPAMCIFSEKGLSAFVDGGAKAKTEALLAILCSGACHSLIEVQLAAADKSQAGGVANAYEVGIVKTTPAPNLDHENTNTLAAFARRAWSLKRMLATIDETSHAFLLPAALCTRLLAYDPPSIEAELSQIQAHVDAIAFDLYGFSAADRSAADRGAGLLIDSPLGDVGALEDDLEEEDSATPVDQTNGLLSWAVGVAFGRFDLRLATGNRAAPPEPEPFDPLPTKSPGRLPEDAKPLYLHFGILVDDLGHPHDLSLVVEEVLGHVEGTVAIDVRRWLQRDFFPFHLQRYSKSRRKAPIYWPLSTSSGGYTLWIYYPNLTSQTLYTAVNDFLEPKLERVGKQTALMRGKGTARSREEDRSLEVLQILETELVELRETLLQIAPTYRPNHDDGVQITAAPLWPLFRHKPWQKLLKDTWSKLEKGEYDWAHLAMAYWPDRVREKCKTDKSLAIAHDLEHLYVPPEPKAAKPRGRRKANEA